MYAAWTRSHRGAERQTRGQGPAAKRGAPAAIAAGADPRIRLWAGLLLFSLYYFDRADGSLTATQDQVTTIQQVVIGSYGAWICNSLVIQVRAALGDRPPGRRNRGDGTGRHHQVGDRRQAVHRGTRGPRARPGRHGDRDWPQLGDCGGEGPAQQIGQRTLAEQGLAGGDRAAALLGAVHQRGELLGQRPLTRPGGGPFYALRGQGFDLLAGLEAEHPQQAGYFGVGNVQPELV